MTLDSSSPLYPIHISVEKLLCEISALIHSSNNREEVRQTPTTLFKNTFSTTKILVRIPLNLRISQCYSWWTKSWIQCRLQTTHNQTHNGLPQWLKGPGSILLWTCQEWIQIALISGTIVCHRNKFSIEHPFYIVCKHC